MSERNGRRDWTPPTFPKPRYPRINAVRESTREALLVSHGVAVRGSPLAKLWSRLNRRIKTNRCLWLRVSSAAKTIQEKLEQHLLLKNEESIRIRNHPSAISRCGAVRVNPLRGFVLVLLRASLPKWEDRYSNCLLPRRRCSKHANSC